jgi:MATE family multidrug resistance protein
MILIATIKPIIEFLGCPEDIAIIVQDYGDVFIWVVPIMQLAIASKLFIESLGKTKITLLSDVLGVGVLLGAGGILSYGALGIRAFGVQGMAYASILQFATIALTGEVYLFGKRKCYGLYDWKESLASRWHTLKRLMAVGYPFIFLATGQIAANYVNLIMITQFGTQALSAQNIAFHYKMLLGIPMVSFCQSASIMLGQANGAGHHRPMRGLFDTAAGGALLYSAATLSVFMLFPDEMTSLFLAFQPDEDNTDLQATLQPLYIATFIGLVEEALLLSSIFALNALRMTPLTTVMGLGSRWLVSLPFSALLGFALNWGVVGIMLGEDIGLLVAAISMLSIWIYQANKILEKNVNEQDYQQLAYIPKVVKKIEKLGSTCKPIWCSHFQAADNKPNNRQQAIELINADEAENNNIQIQQEQDNNRRRKFCI